MIAPDDPRHGSNRGYLAGCTDACCKTAHADYRRNLRTRQYLHGGSLKVDATGTRRRLQALVARGWNLWAIDDALGKKRTYSHNLLQRNSSTILASTAASVSEVYERLAMIDPDTSTSMKLLVANRSKNLARRMGWPPPLAWEDIDDPNEQPDGWEYQPPSRREVLEDLAEQGANVTEACRVLGITRPALQKWCGNHDLHALYRALADREERVRNQYDDRSLEVA